MGVTPEERQEWERICRERIAPNLATEELIAVGPFKRKVWWDAGGDGEVAAFFAATFDEWRVARGKRLPRQFLLALTSDKVHIFDYSGGPVNPVVGREVLVIDRENVRFVGDPKRLTLRLTADASAEDINLEGERRNPDPFAADVVSALSE